MSGEPEDSGVARLRKKGGFAGAENEVRRIGGTFGLSLIRAWRAYKEAPVSTLIASCVLSPWHVTVLMAHKGQVMGALCSMHDMARAVDKVCPSESQLSLLEENDALRAELDRTRRQLAQWRMDREAAE